MPLRLMRICSAPRREKALEAVVRVGHANAGEEAGEEHGRFQQQPPAPGHPDRVAEEAGAERNVGPPFLQRLQQRGNVVNVVLPVGVEGGDEAGPSRQRKSMPVCRAAP